MNRNRRNDTGSENEHMGYSSSDFSPSTGSSGGVGRFRGSNYGGSGSGSYYDAGYETTPYAGGNANPVTGMGRGSYSGGLSGAQGGGHMENRYGSRDRSGSYAGGRIESPYGRDAYHADPGRDWSHNREGDYGVTGGGSDHPYEGRAYGSYNEEGPRRGTSGNFTGPGSGGNYNPDIDQGYGRGREGYHGYGNMNRDNYGAQGVPDAVKGMGTYGGRGGYNYGSPNLGAANTGTSFTGTGMGSQYSGGNYGGTGSYGGSQSSYGAGNYQDHSAHGGGRIYSGGRRWGGDFYEGTGQDWEYSDRSGGGYTGGGTGVSGSNIGRRHRSDFGGTEGYDNRRGRTGTYSPTKGATYGGGMSDNYGSEGEGGGSFERGRNESDFGGGSYGQGRSSYATGGNTSRGSYPGGNTYTDPWL